MSESQPPASESLNPLEGHAEAPSVHVIVHHLNDSRSQRVLWLLEELEIPYELKKYQRTSGLLAPRELLAINPLGKAPVITDGAVTLSESGAIVEYLIAKYGIGKGQPPESGKLDNLYFTHYAEGSLAPIILMKFVFSLLPPRSPFFIRPLLWLISSKLNSSWFDPELKKHGAMIENHLAKGGLWFAGGDQPTSADYMMVFNLETFAALCPAFLGPKTIEYLQRAHARPAFQRSIEKGGEYKYAPKE